MSYIVLDVIFESDLIPNLRRTRHNLYLNILVVLLGGLLMYALPFIHTIFT